MALSLEKGSFPRARVIWTGYMARAALEYQCYYRARWVYNAAMMAYCEDDEHDLDDEKTECDLYMFRGASPAEDRSLFLCEAHRP